MFNPLKHIILFTACFVKIQAQCNLSGSKNVYLKGNVTYGPIVEHRSNFGHLINGYVPSFEIDLVKPTSGSKLWHHENNFPEIGVLFNYQGFHNPTVLGRGYTAAAFCDIPLSKLNKPSRVHMRVSWGGSYITKKFDLEANRRNIVIGSHLNAYVQFKWFWNLELKNNLRLSPGISFSHFSNGNAQTPNLGLNIMALNMGLTYKLKDEPSNLSVPIDSSTKQISKHSITTWFAIGINDRTPPGGPKYLTSAAAIEYQYHVRNTHLFGAGLDIFYEEQNIINFKEKGIPVNRPIDIMQLGTKLCYAYNIGRISLPIDIGFYTLSNYNAHSNMYTRIGVRHYGKKGLILHFLLKTHGAVANNFEIGGGYKFNIKKNNNAN